jgi:hypothetical protein
MSTEEFIPYTYFLYWDDGTKYYGVRYSRTCHPSDLLVTYFTSSKHVKAKIQESGMPHSRVHKIFPGDREAAILYENRVLRILKCPERRDYLNQTYNRAIPAEYNGSEYKRGKTYEEIYGVEKAARLRAMRVESNRARQRVKWCDEARLKMSTCQRGSLNNKAKTIKLTFNNTSTSFGTIKEAALFLSEQTGYKVAGCMSAIRSKLYGKGVTNRKDFQHLYSAFECTSL